MPAEAEPCKEAFKRAGPTPAVAEAGVEGMSPFCRSTPVRICFTVRTLSLRYRPPREPCAYCVTATMDRGADSRDQGSSEGSCCRGGRGGSCQAATHHGRPRFHPGQRCSWLFAPPFPAAASTTTTTTTAAAATAATTATAATAGSEALHRRPAADRRGEAEGGAAGAGGGAGGGAAGEPGE